MRKKETTEKKTEKNIKMKIARMEKNLSQIQLAERVGVTRQTIGMIEAGDFNPSLKLCIAICKELDCTLNDLFWEEKPKSRLSSLFSYGLQLPQSV